MEVDEEEERKKKELNDRLDEERKLQKEMEDDIIASVEEDADAHLDSSLEDESAVLREYLQLVKDKLGEQGIII